MSNVKDFTKSYSQVIKEANSSEALRLLTREFDAKYKLSNSETVADVLAEVLVGFSSTKITEKEYKWLVDFTKRWIKAGGEVDFGCPIEDVIELEEAKDSSKDKTTFKITYEDPYGSERTMTILDAENHSVAEDRARNKLEKSGYSKIIDVSSVDQLKKRKIGELQEDTIPGGKGDNKTNKSFDFNELVMGTKVEMEHTKDPKKAKEIAKDHLTEDPKYYSKLKKAGLADELKEKNMSNKVTPAIIRAILAYKLRDEVSAKEISKKFDLPIRVAEEIYGYDNPKDIEEILKSSGPLKEHHNEEFPPEILNMTLGQFLDHLVGLSPSDPNDAADELYRSIEKFIQDNLEFLKDPSKFPSDEEGKLEEFERIQTCYNCGKNFEGPSKSKMINCCQNCPTPESKGKERSKSVKLIKDFVPENKAWLALIDVWAALSGSSERYADRDLVNGLKEGIYAAFIKDDKLFFQYPETNQEYTYDKESDTWDSP